MEGNFSWIARYDTDGDIINFNEVLDARRRSLDNGLHYLLKVKFTYAPDIIIESAWKNVEDAIAIAKRLINFHPNVKSVVVCHMHGADLFGDGHKHYKYLTAIETFYKPE